MDVIGRYQLIRKLGQGGMASVWQAHDPRFSRDVAIKLLLGDADDPMLRQRFAREAQTIAGLEHHAIVPVYDFGEHEGQLYLVMRLMGGGTLKHRLASGPLPAELVASILTRIASALDRAHENDIIHRDLKPANILFDDEGKPYLSDFGIVKLYREATQITRSGGIVGTPTYMSPEQGLGEPLGRRSDIYSLGVVLFEMVTGRVPFEGDTAIATVLKHIKEPLPPPSSVNPSVAPNVERVIQKALAKQPDQRFATASEMVRALQGRDDRLFHDQTVIDAVPERVAVRRKRPFAPYAVVGALVLMIVISALWAVAGGEQGERESTVTETRAEPVVQVIDASTATAPSLATETVNVTDAATPTPTVSPSPSASPTPPPTSSVTATSTPVPPAALPLTGPPGGQIVFTCFVDGFDNLCRMDADGSDQRRLTYTQATDFYASYTPDGRSIIFSSRRAGQFLVYLMGASGGNPRLVDPGTGGMYAPVVSPDGSQIAYANAIGQRQSIWVMNEDGSNPRRLTDDAGDDVDPVWSPDGAQLAFASDRSGDWGHYVVNADGSGMRRLAADVADIGGRSDWSPDGYWLAFYAGPQNDRDIYLVATNGSGEVRRLTDGGGNLAPSFSPDGGWIAFTSYRSSTDPDIYIMRWNGTDLRQLTDNDRPDWQPRWGP